MFRILCTDTRMNLSSVTLSALFQIAPVDVTPQQISSLLDCICICCAKKGKKCIHINPNAHTHTHPTNKKEMERRECDSDTCTNQYGTKRSSLKVCEHDTHIQANRKIHWNNIGGIGCVAAQHMSTFERRTPARELSLTQIPIHTVPPLTYQHLHVAAKWPSRYWCCVGTLACIAIVFRLFLFKYIVKVNKHLLDTFRVFSSALHFSFRLQRKKIFPSIFVFKVMSTERFYNSFQCQLHFYCNFFA